MLRVVLRVHTTHHASHSPSHMTRANSGGVAAAAHFEQNADSLSRTYFVAKIGPPLTLAKRSVASRLCTAHVRLLDYPMGTWRAWPAFFNTLLANLAGGLHTLIAHCGKEETQPARRAPTAGSTFQSGCHDDRPAARFELTACTSALGGISWDRRGRSQRRGVR